MKTTGARNVVVVATTAMTRKRSNFDRIALEELVLKAIGSGQFPLPEAFGLINAGAFHIQQHRREFRSLLNQYAKQRATQSRPPFDPLRDEAINRMAQGDLIIERRDRRKVSRCLSSNSPWTKPIRIRSASENISINLISFLKSLNICMYSHDKQGRALPRDSIGRTLSLTAQERRTAAIQAAVRGKNSEALFQKYCDKYKWRSEKTKHVWALLRYKGRAILNGVKPSELPRYRDDLKKLCWKIPRIWRRALISYENDLNIPGEYMQHPGRGLPDRCLFIDGRPVCLVEIKSQPGQQLTPLQRNAMKYFKSRGIQTEVWWPGKRIDFSLP